MIVDGVITLYYIRWINIRVEIKHAAAVVAATAASKTPSAPIVDTHLPTGETPAVTVNTAADADLTAL